MPLSIAYSRMTLVGHRGDAIDDRTIDAIERVAIDAILATPCGFVGAEAEARSHVAVEGAADDLRALFETLRGLRPGTN